MNPLSQRTSTDALWIYTDQRLPQYGQMVIIQADGVCKRNISYLKKGSPDYWEVSCTTRKDIPLDSVKKWAPIAKDETMVFFG